MMPRRKKKSILPVVLISIGVLLMLGAVLWVLNPLGTGVAPTPTAPVARSPYPEVTRVSLADAKAAFDTGSAIFIDVRGEPHYSESHIPDALSLTDQDLMNRMDELDKNAWIITYCT